MHGVVFFNADHRATSSSSSSSSSRPHVNEIPYEDLEIEQEALGSGTFKTVHKGRWQQRDVAVLTVRQGSCDMEASTFAQLGRYSALVRFYGISRDREGRDVMVTELAHKGALDGVLEEMDDRGESVSNEVMLRVAMQVGTEPRQFFGHSIHVLRNDTCVLEAQG